MAVLSVAAKKSKAKQKKGSPSGGEGDSKALESMEVVSVPVHVLTNDHMSLIDLTCTVHVYVIDPVVHVHVHCCMEFTGYCNDLSCQTILNRAVYSPQTCTCTRCTQVCRNRILTSSLQLLCSCSYCTCALYDFQYSVYCVSCEIE